MREAILWNLITRHQTWLSHLKGGCIYIYKFFFSMGKRHCWKIIQLKRPTSNSFENLEISITIQHHWKMWKCRLEYSNEFLHRETLITTHLHKSKFPKSGSRTHYRNEWNANTTVKTNFLIVKVFSVLISKSENFHNPRATYLWHWNGELTLEMCDREKEDWIKFDQLPIMKFH